MKIGRKRQQTAIANADFKTPRFFGALPLPALSVAADFQVSASLDRNQIALNEQAVLSLTISGNGGNLPQPQLPGLADFQIYNAGRSQNFTWINGKATSSVTYNYVLTPLKEGKFQIPSIRIQYQGQTRETQPLTLDVVKGDASAVPQGSARQEGDERPRKPRTVPRPFSSRAPWIKHRCMWVSRRSSHSGFTTACRS